MKIIVTLIVALCIGCGATVASVDTLRDDCILHGGIFHVTYTDYMPGWLPDKANCWYGVRPEDMERIKALEE